jgi:autotransporter-associated beta strand protein
MSLLVAGVFAGHVFNATALTWTGLSTVTNLWSDTNNWSPTQPLTFDYTAAFGNAGSTNVIGAVNNVVGADYTLTNLVYSAVFNGPTGAFNFDTTLINNGVTLTVKAPNTTFCLVGNATNQGAAASNYTAIVGTGRLVLGDPASPGTYTNGFLQVKQAGASGLHRAILDMSRLDNFTFAAGKFLVAANGTFGGNGDIPLGTVLLANTNVITCSAPMVTDPSDYLDEQPFTIGQSQGTASLTTATNVVLLGQQNTINADYIRIGGLKMLGQISFRPGLSNPTLKLRGADGVSRVSQIALGDHGEARTTSFVARGNLDLRGGTVDALVDVMWLGKTSWRNISTDTGGATGVLSMNAGTLDVNTLYVGWQQANTGGTVAARGTAIGVVNVFTNATLVIGTLNIGRDAGDAIGTGNGTLNINGGLVTVSGDIAENSVPPGNGTSAIVLNNGGTLNMMPLGDTVPGNITVDTLTIGSATLTNYGTLGLTTLNVQAPATEFTVYPGQALAPVAPGTVGTLTVNGNLTLASGGLRLDLNTPGVNDQINVGGVLTLGGLNTVDVSAAGGAISPGTYTVMSYSSLVGDTNNLQVSGALANSRYNFVFDTTSSIPFVNLTVSGGPTSSLTWSGDGAANLWDLHTTTNWNSHAEKFYDLDTVTFDDTGSTSPAVSLVGTLEPAGVVTVNSANNYTFSGSGKLSGSAGLTKSGTGTLTIATANDYTGDTTINTGTVLVNGALGHTTVNVNGGTLGGSGAILGPVTVQSGAFLAPGASIGTLTIGNNLVLADGSTSVFEANMDTPAHDQVVGLTTVTYGGTLSLVLSGRPVAVTDTFKLFSATTAATAFSTPYGGAFSSILPATPGPAGLAWNTNSLPIDGTLRVVSTAPTSMTLQQSGNQFTLSWAPDHVGWRLQTQINPAGVGLTTNWVDLAGFTTTNSVSVTVNPTNGSVFYRLVYP